MWYIIIFIIALAFRLMYFFQTKSADPTFYHPIMDALYHHEWAISIVKTSWIGSQSFFRAPLYPYLLACIYKVFGVSMIAPRIVQILIGSSSCVLIAHIGRIVYQRKTGIVAGIIASVYPLLIYFDNELLIPTVLIFLTVLGFFMILRQDAEHVTRRGWFLTGLVWGLAAITRPNVLLFLVMLLFWITRKLKTHSARAIVFCCLGIGTAIVPVTVRNYFVSREFVPIAWQGGTNFYIGNNPDSDGFTAIIPGTRKTWWGGYNDAKRIAEKTAGRQLSNSDIDRYWLKQGMDFVTNQPGRAIGLMIKKAYMFFAGLELSNNRDIYFFAHLTYLRFLLVRAPMFQFPFGVLLPLALTGMMLFFARTTTSATNPKRKKEVVLIIIFVASYAVSFILFFVCARYRLPIIPFLIIFASAAATYCVECVKKKQFRKILTPAIVFLAAYAFFNANLYMITQKNPSLNYNTMGVAFKQQGKIQKAVEYYEKAMESEPHRPEAYYNLGNIYAESRDFTMAQRLFEKAIELDRTDARAHNNLGNIYFEAKDYEKALYHYYIAINLEPDYDTPLYHAGLVHRRLGNDQAAETLWRRALLVNPRNEVVRRALEQLQP